MLQTTKRDKKKEYELCVKWTVTRLLTLTHPGTSNGLGSLRLARPGGRILLPNMFVLLDLLKVFMSVSVQAFRSPKRLSPKTDSICPFLRITGFCFAEGRVM